MTAEELARLLQPAVGLVMSDYPIRKGGRKIIAVRELPEDESLDHLPGLVILEYEKLPDQYSVHGPTCDPAKAASIAWQRSGAETLSVRVTGVTGKVVAFDFTGTPEAVAASLARIVTQEPQP